MRDIQQIILHHLGGWPPISKEALNHQSVADGFAQTPYHFAVTQQGEVWECRPAEVNSAANLGLNRTSISISMLGNFDASNSHGAEGPMHPTNAQLVATGELVGRLKKQYPHAVFMQHCDVHKIVPTCLQNGVTVSTATACPGSRITDGDLARLIWLIACGMGLGEARIKHTNELAANVRKHDAFVAEMKVIGHVDDDHDSLGQLIEAEKTKKKEK